MKKTEAETKSFCCCCSVHDKGVCGCLGHWVKGRLFNQENLHQLRLIKFLPIGQGEAWNKQAKELRSLANFILPSINGWFTFT